MCSMEAGMLCLFSWLHTQTDLQLWTFPFVVNIYGSTVLLFLQVASADLIISVSLNQQYEEATKSEILFL